jgi:hypothetical protein
LQLDEVPCIRLNDGSLDREVLDIEETGVGSREALVRNVRGVPEAHAALQAAVESHVTYLRKLMEGGAKVAGQVLAPGRIIVLSGESGR